MQTGFLKPITNDDGRSLMKMQDKGFDIAGHALPETAEYYGIFREKPKKATHGTGWRTCIQRRGIVVWRNFKDDAYGSSTAALFEARAYRDAIIDVLPPMTNKEHAVQLRKNNRTGVAGVFRGKRPSGPYWEAHIHTAEFTKKKKFPVSQYGEERARELAIEQRREWLADWDIELFATVGTYTKAKSQPQITRQSCVDQAVLPEIVSEQEIRGRIAEIDAYFDTRRPSRIRVSVTCTQSDRRRMSIRVSDAGKPATSVQKEVGIRQQTLEEALQKAAERIQQAVTEIYNNDVAQWFMQKYARHFLHPTSFDATSGCSMCVILPEKLINR